MSDEPADILLVEDDPNDLRLALRALRDENMGERVAVARDGEEALDFVYGRGVFAGRQVNERPKVILLDLKLPKLDGLQVLGTIKGDPQMRSQPVVVLTSSREERDLVESYRLGVNSYIQKPLDYSQFRESIRALGVYWLSVNQTPPETAFAPE